jgi:outer membrane immunogenic protein
MIRTVLVGSLVCALTIGATDAAAQTWNGGYVGANAGVAVGKADATTSLPDAGDYFASTSVTSINANGLFELKPKGFLAGGQVGFSVQGGAGVFGIEADFGLMDLSETGLVTVEYPCCAGTDYTIAQTVETTWLLTVRPRVGIAAGNVLVYGTGGLAMTSVAYDATFGDTFAAASARAAVDERRTGWTVGGGLEVQGGRVSFKAEYLLADFGDTTMTSDNFEVFGGPDPTVTFDHVATLRVQVIRAGVNIRF